MLYKECTVKCALDSLDMLSPVKVQYKGNDDYIFKSSLSTVLRGYLLRLIGTDKGSILVSSVSN